MEPSDLLRLQPSEPIASESVLYSAFSQVLVLPVCSVMRTILYIIHLYGKMAFVKALLYLCRSSMEMQHALCHSHNNTHTVTVMRLVAGW